MISVMKRFRKAGFRQTVAFILACNMVINTSAVFATPDVADPGTAAIIQNGNATNVVVQSQSTIIKWNSLDTNIDQSLLFGQNGVSNAAVLNKVISGNTTMFNGMMSAESGMRIFVVNPAGIVFGQGAQINLTQLVASGLDLTDDNFINGLKTGRFEFAGGNGMVVNYGNINAESIALIGKIVQNSGTILTSPGGIVAMTAGDKVVLKQQGSNIAIEIDSVKTPIERADGLLDGDVINTGTINAPQGTVVLASGDIFATAVPNVDSLAVKVDGGTGRVAQNGTINADNGNISLTAGNKVTLENGSLTAANGGTNGNGGNIVVYSSGTSLFNEGAKIQAKGGTQSGNGGFVEFSGKNFLFAGALELTALNGQSGTLLFDPVNLTIANGARPATPDADTVYEQDVENFSQAGVDVRYEADKMITLADLADDFLAGGSGDITLLTRTALNSGIVFEDKNDTIKTTTGDITMVAGT